MRLYLVRHAKAKAGNDDFARPLTRRGLADARRLGKFLGAMAIKVGTVWQSDRKRSKQTAGILVKAMAKRNGRVHVEEYEDLGPDSALSAARRRIEDAKLDLMIVGHQPMLGKLAAKLLVNRKSADLLRFKTSDLVCLEKSGDGKWQIAWIVGPEILKELAAARGHKKRGGKGMRRGV